MKGDILCNENVLNCYKIVSTTSGSTLNQCGNDCYHYNNIFGRCRRGSCVEADNNCSGESLGQLSSGDRWGCKTTIDENRRMECYVEGNVGYVICSIYINETSYDCGKNCNFDGTNCESWTREECAPDSTIDPQKKSCVLGGTVTQTCVCPNVVGTNGAYRAYQEGDTPLAVGQFCCAKDQVVANGACAVNQ